VRIKSVIRASRSPGDHAEATNRIGEWLEQRCRRNKTSQHIEEGEDERPQQRESRMHASRSRTGGKMGLFHTDSVALSYANVEAAKQWWIDTTHSLALQCVPTCS
jgi:hypothetical protein